MNKLSLLKTSGDSTSMQIPHAHASQVTLFNPAKVPHAFSHHANSKPVKIYSATVPDNGNGTVVSACLCLDDDATVDVCFAYHAFDDCWTTVPTKNKKARDLVGKGMSQGPTKAKDSTRIHGIKPVKGEIYGTGFVPVGFTAKSIPPGVPRMRREQRPNQ